MNKRVKCITTLVALMLAAMTMGYAQDIPITLNQGWNWIGYTCSEPMSVNEALSSFTPSNGDIILSRSNGNATYSNGRWRGALQTLIPGEGYMYQSVDGTTKSFIFGGAANDPSALPEEALDGEFTVDADGTKVRFSPGNLQCRIDPNKVTEATVGTETETQKFVPYNTNYNYSLCQMIYKAEELVTAGVGPGSITGIAFESYSALHYLRNNITIWMSATELTTAPSTSVSTSGMTQVFSGSLIQQDGWTPVYFSTPFIWDGESNLMVTVAMSHGSWGSSTYWQSSSPGFTCCNYKYNDDQAYDPSSTTYSMNTRSKRPNTRFNGKGGVTWRFAEQQMDYIGEGNTNISNTYTGWIDLFGWGTSGHPHGAVCFQPWSTSSTGANYYAYGDASYNLYDQTGEADWGCNPISNGGDKPNQWRTLTQEEWAYVINTRTTSSGKRYAKAQVDGVNGLIVLPDDWKTSYYTLNSTNSSGAAFTSNTITATQWQTLEQKGAVFLPAAGYRGGNVYNSGAGYYWSASCNGSGTTYSISVSNLGLDVPLDDNARYGNAVRLVCQTNPRIRTMGATGVTSTGASVSAMVECSGSATVGARGVCWNSTGAPTVSDSHVASGTGVGSFAVQLTDLSAGTTYYVRAYAVIGGTTRYGNVLTFTTPDDGSNGHAYVDLGLPSGLLWATCNVGATSPEDYGDYFAWGETTTKDEYDWSNYQHCNGSNTTMTKYCTNADYGNNGFVDNLTVLFPEDDAATANWGGNWRMPTNAEWEELYNNTTVVWTTQNGVNGHLFTATNGNSIFLPAAGYCSNGSLNDAGSYGYYWSSSLNTGYPSSAWCFYFNSGNYFMINYYRYFGRSVRPVRSSQN